MSKTLKFTMQHQGTDDWCWAATAVSISLHYDNNTEWAKQCKLVNKVLRRDTCCVNPHSPGCGTPLRLDIALDQTQNLNEVVDGQLTLQGIKDQIEAGMVIAIRIEWASGEGHFITLHGYQENALGGSVAVADPKYPSGMYNLAYVKNNYQQIGSRWSTTYLIKSPKPVALDFIADRVDFFAESTKINPRHERKIDRTIDFTKPEKTTHTNPHLVYTIDYASLVEDKKPKLSRYEFRVLGSSQNNENYIYDFSGKAANSKLIQIINDPGYNRNIQEILQQISRNAINLTGTYELRLVRQAELGVEAFWLHHFDKRNDIFIPTLPNRFFEKGRHYFYEAFFTILKQAAKDKAQKS